MELLLISNSTMAGEAYLDYPKYDIRDFLGAKPVKALFIPYAGVTLSWDDYEARVKTRFNEVGHDVVSIHRFSGRYDTKSSGAFFHFRNKNSRYYRVKNRIVSLPISGSRFRTNFSRTHRAYYRE